MSINVSHVTSPSGKEIEVKAAEYANYSQTAERDREGYFIDQTYQTTGVNTRNIHAYPTKGLTTRTDMDELFDDVLWCACDKWYVSGAIYKSTDSAGNTYPKHTDGKTASDLDYYTEGEKVSDFSQDELRLLFNGSTDDTNRVVKDENTYCVITIKYKDDLSSEFAKPLNYPNSHTLYSTYYYLSGPRRASMVRSRSLNIGWGSFTNAVWKEYNMKPLEYYNKMVSTEVMDGTFDFNLGEIQFIYFPAAKTTSYTSDGSTINTGYGDTRLTEIMWLGRRHPQKQDSIPHKFANQELYRRWKWNSNQTKTIFDINTDSGLVTGNIEGTATGIKDAGDGRTLKFNYSTPALPASNVTWLGAWNGNTLQAVTQKDLNVNSAKYADYPSGFASRSNSILWGTLTPSNGYDYITRWDTAGTGSIAFAQKAGGSDHQLSMQLDGDIYVQEGKNKVATESYVQTQIPVKCGTTKSCSYAS